jgi:hypothetical protein
MKLDKISLTVFLRILFVPIFYELVIGGGGHYLEFGSFTARMLFYTLSLSLSLIYYLFKNIIKKDVIIIVASLTLTCILSVFIGLLNNATLASILEDLKPLSFIYIILFFSIIIKNENDILKIVTIIKTGSLILASVYIIIIFLLFTEKIDFMDFYIKQNDIGEIMFRNDTLFFYKGFLYLCIGFFFYLFSKSKYAFFILIFLLTCIMLTLMRGFIFFTILIFIYFILVINKNIFLKYFVIISLIVGIVLLGPFLLETLGDKSSSDSVRYFQIEQVFSAINPVSFLIGHGFGIGVPIRQVHMEISFLEIFHKQGIIGLFFWIGMFFHIFYMYSNIKIRRFKTISLPFLLSVIFIILQSITNPYMNNPIGLSMILITIVVFSKLIDMQKQTIS